MKINFVLASFNLSGGNKVASIYANWLVRNGHEVTVVAGRRVEPSLRQKIRALAAGTAWPTSKGNAAHFTGNPAKLIEVDAHRPIVDADVPDGDIVIASWWQVLEWVADLSPEKGEKVSFLQGYEIAEGPLHERLRDVWRRPFPKIVVSRWLKDIAESEFGDSAAVLVPNGVSLEQFHADPRGRQECPTVGLLYSHSSAKGTDIALEAIDIARQRLSDLRVVAFGATRPKPGLPLPAGSEFHLRPPQHELRKIYAKCDVWLFPTRAEGFGLPILEAMACRTPVIAAPAGAAPDIIDEGCGNLLSSHDPKAMADAIKAFFSGNEAEWQRLSRTAYSIARRYQWDRSCKLFEQALLDIAERRR